jgi:hypothetical protein
MLATHKIPYQMTRSIKELLEENPNWYSVIVHIHHHLPEVKKTPRICDISFWQVIQSDGRSQVYCQEDSGCEPKFIGRLPFKLPPQKFYLCLNELDGYTLMLPEDY